MSAPLGDGRFAGLLLAAGSGSRLGGPKALLTDEAGQPFVAMALEALADGGCAPLHVIVGAAADDVRAHLPAHAQVTVAAGWAEGMGFSLRAGLDTLIRTSASSAEVEAVVVMLVDTPGVTAAVVRRLITRAQEGAAAGRSSSALSTALSRASYDGVPGHPVLIGRAHWAGVRQSAGGDRGARDYLRSHDVVLVESADIGSGDDIDTSAALARWRGRRPTR